MAKKRDVKIVQDPEAPIVAEVLAAAIVQVSDGMRALLNAGLSKRALVVLIYDRANAVSKRDIETILDVIPDLKFHYLTSEGRAKLAAKRA